MRRRGFTLLETLLALMVFSTAVVALVEAVHQLGEHTLLRRHEGSSEAQAPGERRRLQFGQLVIDSAMREAWLGEQSIELTSAEFDLLWLLTSNAGRILSREEIFNALRGIEYDGQDRSIDVRISRIRPKIGDDPMHPRLIKTVRSKGYLFVAEAAEAMA